MGGHTDRAIRRPGWGAHTGRWALNDVATAGAGRIARIVRCGVVAVIACSSRVGVYRVAGGTIRFVIRDAVGWVRAHDRGAETEPIPVTLVVFSSLITVITRGSDGCVVGRTARAIGGI